MKTVHYSAITIGPIAVGNRVELIPINHPGYRELKGTGLEIVNGLPCFTTPIRAVGADGTTFETMNTRYVHHVIPDDKCSTDHYLLAKEDTDNA